MNARGHTLIELMIASILIGSFFALLSPLAAQLHRSDRVAAAYVEDLTRCRRALRVLEADIRQARGVENRADLLRVYHPDGVIEYGLDRGTLTRSVQGRSAVVSRRIGALEAFGNGRLVRLKVAVQARAATPGREAVVETTIYMRNGGR